MEVTHVEQRAYIKIAVLRERNAMECRSELVEALGIPTIPYGSTVDRKVSALSLAWARQHRHWTVDDWKHVAWSDKSRFQLNRVGVWRQLCDGLTHFFINMSSWVLWGRNEWQLFSNQPKK
ncbi:hypothetical protein TNCV_3303981 [Trichonephila clavipes]|nr:hypothetical protein TNCV_3303981 [Trichonephila clavipes]